MLYLKYKTPTNIIESKERRKVEFRKKKETGARSIIYLLFVNVYRKAYVRNMVGWCRLARGSQLICSYDSALFLSGWLCSV